MKHLLKVLEVKHWRKGKVIWENKNLLNSFHLEGEKFMLSTVFRSAEGIVIPSFFYLGMDNRSSPSVSDNMASINTEPTGNGYSRQPISSATGFTIDNYTADSLSHWRAISQIIAFSAAGGGWGPVQNVFLTDRSDNTGYLISTAPLGETRTVASGEELTFKFEIKLVDDA